MKKGIVIGIVLCLCLGAAQPISKYWQDVIRKPNQTWIEQYGYDNESVLAFNVRSLLEVQNNMARELVELKAQVASLADPNEVE
jgi:hypothetical protein